MATVWALCLGQLVLAQEPLQPGAEQQPERPLGTLVTPPEPVPLITDPAPSTEEQPPPPVEERVPLWTENQSALEFMDNVGKVAKARWRSLYRSPPPTPSSDRFRTAVTLGALVAESLVCVQATDAQHFRNNNQEITTYARTLGLAEKITPVLMTQAKMAESGTWQELREEVVKGQQLMVGALLNQRDEELVAVLELGLWMRILEVVSAVVLEAEDQDLRLLCVGSPTLLTDLQAKWDSLSQTGQETEVAQELKSLVEFLHRHWANSLEVTPPREVLEKTHEKLSTIARKLTLR